MTSVSLHQRISLDASVTARAEPRLATTATLANASDATGVRSPVDSVVRESTHESASLFEELRAAADLPTAGIYGQAQTVSQAEGHDTAAEKLEDQAQDRADMARSYMMAANNGFQSQHYMSRAMELADEARVLQDHAAYERELGAAAWSAAAASEPEGSPLRAQYEANAKADLAAAERNRGPLHFYGDKPEPATTEPTATRTTTATAATLASTATADTGTTTATAGASDAPRARSPRGSVARESIHESSSFTQERRAATELRSASLENGLLPGLDTQAQRHDAAAGKLEDQAWTLAAQASSQRTLAYSHPAGPARDAALALAKEPEAQAQALLQKAAQYRDKGAAAWTAAAAREPEGSWERANYTANAQYDRDQAARDRGQERGNKNDDVLSKYLNNT